MKTLTTKCVVFLIAILTSTGLSIGAELIVPYGYTYNLPSGDLEFDFVSIDGTVVLTGDSNITCVGIDGFFYLSPTGIIKSPIAANNSANNGTNGINGADGTPNGGHGQNGTAGTGYNAPPGSNGYSLTIVTDHDITLHGTINLSGNPGYNHTGHGGLAGNGGNGADGLNSGVRGGNGGRGSSGGDSVGGKGGNAGNLTLVAVDGQVDCTDLSVIISGGAGGTGSTGGKGGDGGDGGNGASAGGSGGDGGNGGNGGKGGNSVGGNGGNAGNLKITSELGIMTNNLSLVQNVGPGGIPGTPGARGLPGSRGYGGSAGWPYSNGSSGYPGSYGIPGTQIQGSKGTEGTYTEEYTGCLAKIKQGFTIIADLNSDCYVDIKDFAIFASYWLQCIDPDDPLCDKPWL